MKKYIILTFLFLNICFSQTPLTINWEKNFGGTNFDESWSVIQTSDGNYVFAGRTSSINFNLSSSYGGQDFMVIKINSQGTIIWSKNYGGNGQDHAYDLKEDSFGNLIIVGNTNSTNGMITQFFGNSDIWIIKIDQLGNLIWQKSLGYQYSENANSVEITHNNDGYLVCGRNQMSGQNNLWILKLDLNGNIVWENTYNTIAFAREIIKSNDGNYVICGNGFSSGVAGYKIIKISPSGNIIWEYTYGGNSSDEPNKIIQTSDGGFIIVGGSASSISGDVLNHYGAQGTYDGWVIKLNSLGILEWSKNYGGTNDENLFGVVELCDGYILSGYTNSSDFDINNSIGGFDFVLFKTDFNGNIIWSKNYGSPGWDFCYDMILNNNNEILLTVEKTVKLTTTFQSKLTIDFGAN